jgi:hypothetical protein
MQKDRDRACTPECLPVRQAGVPARKRVRFPYPKKIVTIPKNVNKSETEQNFIC